MINNSLFSVLLILVGIALFVYCKKSAENTSYGWRQTPRCLGIAFLSLAMGVYIFLHSIGWI